jgi:hypothetical protein
LFFSAVLHATNSYAPRRRLSACHAKLARVENRTANAPRRLPEIVCGSRPLSPATPAASSLPSHRTHRQSAPVQAGRHARHSGVAPSWAAITPPRARPRRRERRTRTADGAPRTKLTRAELAQGTQGEADTSSRRGVRATRGRGAPHRLWVFPAWRTGGNGQELLAALYAPPLPSPLHPRTSVDRSPSRTAFGGRLVLGSSQSNERRS